MKKLYALLTSSFFYITLIAQPGTLDPSFGKNGKVITDVGNDEDYVAASAVQADGKIVVGGTYDAASSGRLYEFVVARYNTNGTRDFSFGSNGIVTSMIGNSFSQVNAVAITSTGNILAAGYANLGGYFNQLCVVQYSSKGKIDSSFGKNGIAFYTIPDNLVYGYAIALQPDGKFVVAGYSQPYFDDTHAMVVARFTSKGRLDTSFGNRGGTTISIGDKSAAKAIALLPSGKIIIAGDGTINNNFYHQVALARLTAAGKLDSTFGENGKVYTAVGIQSYANALAITPQGKLYVAGFTQSASNNDFLLVRYTSNGKVDSAKTAAIITTDFNNSSDVANSMVVQADNKIVLVGKASTTESKFALARFNANGKPDLTFGKNGKAVTQFSNSTNSAALAASIQADGKIIAAGYTTSQSGKDFAIARYFTDGTAELEPENNIGISEAVKIYPNPAHQYLQIQGLPATKQTPVSVIDLQGNVRLTAIASPDNFKLNISSLKAGNYLINFKINGEVQSKVFIKE